MRVGVLDDQSQHAVRIAHGQIERHRGAKVVHV
jgi:hypothetical protein